MAEQAREIVLDILLEMEKNRTYSHQLVRAVLDKYDYLEPREKRFIKRLTEGCIERQIELDYCLEQFSTVTVRRMKPLIRCLMRMGAYQILYMDSVPDAAVCNEAVKLAAKRRFVNLKGFVNGVLRKLSACKEQIPMPDAQKEPVKYLSVRYSMPEWIVQMWLQDYGREDAERILEGLLSVHPVSIRFQISVSQTEREKYLKAWEGRGVQVHPSPYLSYAYVLENVDGVAGLEGFEEGAFTVQDVSSMLCVEAAGVKPGDVLFDVCAAPGGKTALAAQYAAQVLSRDVSFGKAEQIRENIERLGLSEKVKVEVWDATVTDESRRGCADVLFMDVPCSGLGVIGKKRDIKYHVTQESIESLITLQKSIVEASLPYVKRGGTVVYSTCTIDRRENEEMCSWMAERYPLRLLEKRQILPGFMEADGFFYAVFRRE